MAKQASRATETPLLPFEKEGPRTSGRVERVLDAYRAADTGDNPDDDEVAEGLEEAPVSEGAEDPVTHEAEEPEDLAADDEPTDEEDVDLDGEEPLFELDLPEGETVEVTLSELGDGYLRQADYTRKTQDLAEKRKQLQEEAKSAREAREQYRARLEQLSKLVETNAPKERTAEEWDALRREDAERYHKEWTDTQRWKADQEALRAEQERIDSEAREEWEAQITAQLQREQAALMEVFEWENEEQAGEQLAELQSYAVDAYGYSEEQLGQVYDHRLIVILDKARRFDELMAKKEQLGPKLKKAPRPTMKSGGRIRQTAGKVGSKAHKERAARLRRTGKASDALAVIKGAIEEGVL